MRAVATGGRAGKARHHKFLQRRKERKKEGNEGGGRTSSDTVHTRADRKSLVRHCNVWFFVQLIFSPSFA